MADFSVDISKFRNEAYRVLTGMLEPKQIERHLGFALRAAIKDSLDPWTDNVLERYRYSRNPKKGLRVSGFTNKAEGKVTISGPVQALTYFDYAPVTPPRPTWAGSFPQASAAVLYNSSMRKIRGEPKPFVARVINSKGIGTGHIAIMRRVSSGSSHKDGKAVKAKEQMYSRVRERLLRESQKYDLTKIVQDFGPSLAQMYGNEEVRDKMLEGFEQRMERNFARELARAAIKAGGEVVKE